MENITILDIFSKQNIRKIIHFSDIHISIKYKKPNECKYILDKFVDIISKEEIINNETEIDLCILCGDVFDKVKLFTKEELNLFINFVMALTKFITLIIIPGNHDITAEDAIKICSDDTSVNFQSSEDILNVISKGITNNNYYYINSNKLINFNNAQMWHKTAFEIKSNKIFNINILQDQKLICKNKLQILLFHFTLNVPMMKNNYINNDVILKKKDLITYDLCLLGDNHFKQVGLLISNSKKTYAYPGSLYQLNYGEEIDHGFFIWDIRQFIEYYSSDSNKINLKETFKFIKIENIYKMITIDFDKIEEYKTLNIPGKILIKLTNLPYIFNKDIIQSKLPNLDIFHYHPILKKFENKIENINTNEKTTINEISFQEFLNNDEDLLKISNKFNLKSFEKNTMQIVFTKFIINKFSIFKNKFVINFENSEPITCIFGKNAIGKTTVIRALLYSIHGEQTLNLMKENNKIDNKKIEFDCDTELYFKLKKDLYKILRNKGNVSIYKNEILITSQKKEANTIILDIFGDLDFITNSWISLENDFPNLLKLKNPREKIELFENIFNLHDFKNVIKEIKNKKKENKISKEIFVKEKEKIILELEKLIDTYDEKFSDKSIKDLEMQIKNIEINQTEFKEKNQNILSYLKNYDKYKDVKKINIKLNIDLNFFEEVLSNTTLKIHKIQCVENVKFLDYINLNFINNKQLKTLKILNKFFYIKPTNDNFFNLERDENKEFDLLNEKTLWNEQNEFVKNFLNHKNIENFIQSEKLVIDNYQRYEDICLFNEKIDIDYFLISNLILKNINVSLVNDYFLIIDNYIKYYKIDKTKYIKFFNEENFVNIDLIDFLSKFNKEKINKLSDKVVDEISNFDLNFINKYADEKIEIVDFDLIDMEKILRPENFIPNTKLSKLEKIEYKYLSDFFSPINHECVLLELKNFNENFNEKFIKNNTEKIISISHADISQIDWKELCSNTFIENNLEKIEFIFKKYTFKKNENENVDEKKIFNELKNINFYDISNENVFLIFTKYEELFNEYKFLYEKINCDIYKEFKYNEYILNMNHYNTKLYIEDIYNLNNLYEKYKLLVEKKIETVNDIDFDIDTINVSIDNLKKNIDYEFLKTHENKKFDVDKNNIHILKNIFQNTNMNLWCSNCIENIKTIQSSMKLNSLNNIIENYIPYYFSQESEKKEKLENLLVLKNSLDYKKYNSLLIITVDKIFSILKLLNFNIEYLGDKLFKFNLVLKKQKGIFLSKLYFHKLYVETKMYNYKIIQDSENYTTYLKYEKNIKIKRAIKNRSLLCDLNNYIVLQAIHNSMKYFIMVVYKELLKINTEKLKTNRFYYNYLFELLNNTVNYYNYNNFVQYIEEISTNIKKYNENENRFCCLIKEHNRVKNLNTEYNFKKDFLENKLAELNAQIENKIDEKLYDNFANKINEYVYFILNNKLIYISNQMNAVLEKLNKKITIRFSKKNDNYCVNFYLINLTNENVLIPIGNISNSESWIINYLFRYNLIKLFKTHYTNIMFIDEGFGTLDEINIIYMLENMFDNFVEDNEIKLYLISHIKILQENINSFINLNSHFENKL